MAPDPARTVRSANIRVVPADVAAGRIAGGGSVLGGRVAIAACHADMPDHKAICGGGVLMRKRRCPAAGCIIGPAFRGRRECRGAKATAITAGHGRRQHGQRQSPQGRYADAHGHLHQL